MYKLSSFVFLIIVMFNSLGCDSIHGVSHVLYKAPKPEKTCIEKAILSVPNVSNLKYKKVSSGRPITLHGLEKADEVNYYFYKYLGLNGNLYFNVNYKEETTFFHTYIGMNKVPSQNEIDKIRPIMFQIESEIEKQCGLVDFSSKIEERCFSVKCE